MITRSLTRRLADLESRIQPVATIPTVIRFNFVEGDGTVVGHQEFIVNAPASPPPRRRGRAS